VDLDSADAATLGTLFTVGLGDTEGHEVQSSRAITTPGAQALLFPFTSFVAGTADGPFGPGSGPVDPASSANVALQIVSMNLDAQYAISRIQTFDPAPSPPVTPVPEPSSLLLALTIGGGLLGCVRLRRKQ
jgi:hypothetical protein